MLLQKTLRNYCLRCCSLRSLFVINCLVLVLNLVLYLLNTHHDVESPWSWWPLDAYFVAPLSAGDRRLLDRTLAAFVEAVEGANVTYFMTGGTLIGSLRHHGRIPWDDDVDILVSVDDKARLRDALSRLDPDFGLYVSGGEGYHSQWKFYPTGGHFVFHRQYRTPYIDVFFYLENKTHVWNASPIWSRSEVWARRVIFPLTRRPYGELSLPAPCNSLVAIRHSTNISECRGRDFNHLLEIPLWSRPVSVPCDGLAHLYPFVKRKTRSNGSTVVVQETLTFRNWTLREITFRQVC